MDVTKLCPGCMEDDSGEPVCPKCGRPAELDSKNSLQLRPRTMLRDQYLIGRALGHGGFGITYLAWDVGLETRLAVKEYMPSGVAGRAAGDTKVLAYSEQTKQEFEYGLDRFLEEARVLKRFRDHPGIVSIDTVFRDNGTAYLVMEYLDGVTFQDFLGRRGGKITFETAQRVMLPVMDALGAVHAEGILHRDISPDNIYLTRNGKVKLIDFGAARNALSQKSRNLSIILKEGYAPEEQYRASGVQGPWTDVYATAATLYHAITGQIPQPSLDRQAEDKLARPSRLGVEIDPRAEGAIMKALSVRAAERYQSMQDFKSALSGGVSAPPAAPHPAPSIAARPPVPPPPPAPVAAAAAPKSRWMWPAILGVAAVASVVAVMVTNHPAPVSPSPNPAPSPTPVPVPNPNPAPAPAPNPAPKPRPNPPTPSPKPTPSPTPPPNPAPNPTPPPPNPTPAPAPAPNPAPVAADYDTITNQADQLAQRNASTQAVQLLNRAIQMDPSKPRAYDMLAQLQLYVFGQLPVAIQNYQAAIAHGGSATFHVYHDHGSGNFALSCKGWLYVSKSAVRFMAFDSVHTFSATRSQVREFKKNRFFLNAGRQGIDPHAFHVKLDDGRNFNFAPMSRFTEAERDLIINIAGME